MYYFPLLVFFRGFKFQLAMGVHDDALMMSLNLIDIAILNIDSVDYHCILNGISKSEGVSILQNTDFNVKRGT